MEARRTVHKVRTKQLEVALKMRDLRLASESTGNVLPPQTRITTRKLKSLRMQRALLTK
jgi:hypothetical protein